MSRRQSSEPRLHSIESEFLESPGLRLSLDEARRLFHMDAEDCRAVLEALVATQFLRRTRDAILLRNDQGQAQRLERPGAGGTFSGLIG